MKNTRFFIFCAIFSLSLATLACSVFVGGPEYPTAPVVISTEAAGSLEEQVKAAQTAAAESGLLSLSVSETQITSLLTAKLAADPDPFLRDPLVTLRNGEIQIYGKVIQGNLEANVRIAVAASINAEGQPVLTVTSVDFGPLPAPEGLNQTISAMVSEAFTGALGPAATGLRLESIVIAEGIMTLTGQVK